MDFNRMLSEAVASAHSVHVTEYQQISPMVARVIATVSGPMTQAERTECIQRAIPGVSPIRASFRWLDESEKFMIGYVTPQPEVRQMPTQEVIKSSYRVVAGNLYMDASDNVWEVKDGAGGKYLTRTCGPDSLASAIEASRQSPTGSTPRMYQVRSCASRPHEFVAFVNVVGTTAEVDYGFCVESGTLGGQRAQRVLSSTTGTVTPVVSDLIIGSYQPGEIKASGLGKITAAADRSAAIEYYRKAYSYAPDYVEKVIRQIEEMAAM